MQGRILKSKTYLRHVVSAITEHWACEQLVQISPRFNLELPDREKRGPAVKDREGYNGGGLSLIYIDVPIIKRIPLFPLPHESYLGDGR